MENARTMATRQTAMIVQVSNRWCLNLCSMACRCSASTGATAYTVAVLTAPASTMGTPKGSTQLTCLPAARVCAYTAAAGDDPWLSGRLKSTRVPGTHV